MKYTVLFLAALAFLSGCVQKQTVNLAKLQPTETSSREEVQTIQLQYRTAMDAVAPSQFVALYPDGMTIGLKIHWKIGNEEKAELDTVIAELEKGGVNGQEFIARAKWIYKGLELEVYEIDRKF